MWKLFNVHWSVCGNSYFPGNFLEILGWGVAEVSVTSVYPWNFWFLCLIIVQNDHNNILMYDMLTVHGLTKKYFWNTVEDLNIWKRQNMELCKKINATFMEQKNPRVILILEQNLTLWHIFGNISLDNWPIFILIFLAYSWEQALQLRYL